MLFPFECETINSVYVISFECETINCAYINNAQLFCDSIRVLISIQNRKPPSSTDYSDYSSTQFNNSCIWSTGFDIYKQRPTEKRAGKPTSGKTDRNVQEWVI